MNSISPIRPISPISTDELLSTDDADFADAVPSRTAVDSRITLKQLLMHAGFEVSPTVSFEFHVRSARGLIGGRSDRDLECGSRTKEHLG